MLQPLHSVDSLSLSLEEYLIKTKEIHSLKCTFKCIFRYSIKSNRWIVVSIESPRGVPPLDLLSFSAATQINERDILVFGGYDNT